MARPVLALILDYLGTPASYRPARQANTRLAEVIADTVRAANDNSAVSKLALNIGRNQVRAAEILIEQGDCKRP